MAKLSDMRRAEYLRKVTPRVTSADFEELEAMAGGLEQISANLDAIQSKFGLKLDDPPRKPNVDSPGITRLGAMRRYDPERFEREVRKAMRDASGRIPRAAESLGVSVRTLYRWLDDANLSDVPRAEVGTRPDSAKRS